MIRNNSPRKGLRGSAEALTQVGAGVFERLKIRGKVRLGELREMGWDSPRRGDSFVPWQGVWGLLQCNEKTE